MGCRKHQLTAYICVSSLMLTMKTIPNLRKRYKFVEGNFLILTVTWILMNFTGPIPQTYSSLYFQTLGADEFFLGIINFCGSIAIALVQLPGGYLADKHGRRWLVLTMTYGVAASFIFFVFAPSWHFIILGLVVQNLCMIYQPALFAIMLDSVGPEHRGTGFTLETVLTNIVSLPAALIAGYLILIFRLDLGMRIAYAIALVTYFAAATLRSRLKETLASDNVGNIHSLLMAIREYPKFLKEGLQIWNRVSKSAFHLFVANAGMNSLIAGCQTYFVIYATYVLGIEKFQWAIVMAFMALSSAIPGILAGFRMDVAGRKRFLIIGILLYIPAMFIFVNASFYMLLVAFFFFGLGQMLQATSYNSLMGDLTPRELRGKVIGSSHFFMYLSQAFTQILTATMYVYVSPQLPFVLLAVCAVPFSILVFFKVFEAASKEI